jgi:hypothetical protein
MAHPYIDCARKLVAEACGRTTSIPSCARRRRGIVHRLWEPLAAKQAPPNGYAAKFSIPYAVAVGMLRGDAGLAEYEAAVVHDPAVRALAAKGQLRGRSRQSVSGTLHWSRQRDTRQRRGARSIAGLLSRRQGCADAHGRSRSEVSRQTARTAAGATRKQRRRVVQLRGLAGAAMIDLRALRG